MDASEPKAAPPVFSAHAEVVPGDPSGHLATSRILRARGGSSEFIVRHYHDGEYSPRTRR